MRAALVVAALVAGAPACSSALRHPDPLLPAAAMSGRAAVELMAEASAAWALRPDLTAVARADALYSEAAMVDHAGTDVVMGALIGALKAKAWITQHGHSAERRDRAAVSAVDAALWCEERRPKTALCDYWLAIAIGMQARERASTGADGMRQMDKYLRRAIATEPGLDEGGPHRVRALLLLRAPGWPLGIGDADAGLEEARAAVALGPEHPHNHLVLGEALVAAGDDAAARAAYTRAIELARARLPTDPEANDWIAEAEKKLADL